MMKTDRNMQELLLKFIREECSPKEIEEILAYVKSVKGIEGMPSFEDVLSLLDEVPDMEHDRAQAIYTHIVKEGKKRPNTFVRKRIIRYASAAAVLIGVLTLGYFFQQGAFVDDSKNLLMPDNDAITLELDNGTLKVIDEDRSEQLMDAKGQVVGQQDKTKLTYSPTAETGELVYNTLTVPYGKRFDVVLSDGTTVYMNSGTELKYPIAFLPKGNREVFVNGEAFFDVAKDAHRPFRVNAAELNVEVLGTAFNVLAYPEDELTDVVLVEGSVGMYANKGTMEEGVILSPGLKGSFDKRDSRITTEEVNTKVYTSWRNGELVYRNLPFKQLLKKLERHYNIKMVLDNPELGQEPFSASFDNKTIEEVLSYFDEIYGIDYTISDNTVHIN